MFSDAMPSTVQHNVAAIEEKLKELIGEQLQVVTYKWLARHFSLPSALAKQLLYTFAEAHAGKAASTYLLSGWTKPDAASDGAEGQRHVVQLVDAGRLEQRRTTLDPVTSLHVYSVQPAQPKDTSHLWNTDHEQTQALFAALLKGGLGGGNGHLVGASLSGVVCEAAVRDFAAIQRLKLSGVSAPVVPASAAASTPKPKVAEAVKVADLPKAAQPTLRGKQAASDNAEGSAAPAAAKGTDRSAAKKPASALSGLWSKAPPKKAAPAKAKQGTAALPAGDADAALRAAQESDTSSSSDNEDAAVAARGSRRSRINCILEEDDGDNEAGAAAPPMAAMRKSAPQKPASVAAAASSDKDANTTKQAPKHGCQGAAAAAEAADDLQQEAEALPAKLNTKAKIAAPAAKTGRVKASEQLGGGKRRKVMRSTYDKKGEEITEMVWEDEVDGAADSGEPAAKSQPEESQPTPQAAASSPRRADSGHASGSARASPQKKASGNGRGSGGARGSGGGRGMGGRGSGAAAKKSGKGKAATGNQRGIMSFFGAPKKFN